MQVKVIIECSPCPTINHILHIVWYNRKTMPQWYFVRAVLSCLALHTWRRNSNTVSQQLMEVQFFFLCFSVWDRVIPPHTNKLPRGVRYKSDSWWNLYFINTQTAKMGISWKKLKDREYHRICLTFAEAKGVSKEIITKKSDFLSVLKRPIYLLWTISQWEKIDKIANLQGYYLLVLQIQGVETNRNILFHYFWLYVVSGNQWKWTWMAHKGSE